MNAVLRGVRDSARPATVLPRSTFFEWQFQRDFDRFLNSLRPTPALATLKARGGSPGAPLTEEAGDYWFAAMQLNSVTKPPSEFNHGALDGIRGAVSKSVSCQTSCQHATGRILPTPSWHVRYTRDTS
jgi:hypothetical protein